VEKTKKPGRYLYSEYRIFLAICFLLIAAAFVLDSPAEVVRGLRLIILSWGLLLTDYIVVGGIGAAIINSTLVGFYAVLLLYLTRAKPCGATVMSLWMSVGFTYWGTNIISMLPITCGVFLYARLKKHPLSDHVIPAILSATIAPIVNMFYFSNPIMSSLGVEWHIAVNILIGILAGLVCGFLLPIVAGAAVRMHRGYTLYNIGVAGGIIAMFVAAGFNSAGIEIPVETEWHSGSNVGVSIFLYFIYALLIVIGFWSGRKKKIHHFQNIRKMCAETGRAPNDFYLLYGCSVYINMGLLGAIGTTVTLLAGGSLNGATLAAIFTMLGFGSLGKHIKNVMPLLLGAGICAYLNHLDMAEPSNIAAILFATCLAPIAGKYGWIWGTVAGFLHVVVVMHVSPLTNGFNLYNSGFASGFSAFFLVPVITALKKDKDVAK
jgi:hypothetical protein